jgi:hypothetical protein
MALIGAAGTYCTGWVYCTGCVGGAIGCTEYEAYCGVAYCATHANQTQEANVRSRGMRSRRSVLGNELVPAVHRQAALDKTEQMSAAGIALDPALCPSLASIACIAWLPRRTYTRAHTLAQAHSPDTTGLHASSVLTCEAAVAMRQSQPMAMMCS